MIYNKIQNAELVRGETFISYMEDPEQVAIYSSFLPFFKRYGLLKTHFGLFKDEANKKGKTKSNTVTKAGLKRTIAQVLGMKLGMTFDYATDINDEGLKTLVKYSKSDILKMKDGDILPFVTNLSKNVFTTDLLDNVKFKDYNVTAKDISDIMANAVLFNSKIGKRKKDDNSSSSANDNMDSYINLIHLDFDSMDITVKEFEEKNPEFVSGYFKNKQIEDSVGRHEGIGGTVRKNGVIQPNAFVGEVGSDKGTTANNEAVYKLYLLPGKHTIQAKNENGDHQTKDVIVEQKKMGDVDFDLE